MPAVATGGQGGGDELGPGDEIKVFKDEGEDEREQGASESLQAELLEEKSSLITESEQVRSSSSSFFFEELLRKSFPGLIIPFAPRPPLSRLFQPVTLKQCQTPRFFTHYIFLSDLSAQVL